MILMKNRKRLCAAVLALLCLSAFSLTVSASDGGYYASDENGGGIPPDHLDNIEVETESVSLPERDGSAGEPLTPDGNLTLIDDILTSDCFASVESKVAEKQFITVKSKNGNYFYLVIDRAGDTENVYFLNLVDEADLLALMEETPAETTAAVCICTDKCAVGAINTACEVCRTDLRACAGKEGEPTNPAGGETVDTGDPQPTETGNEDAPGEPTAKPKLSYGTLIILTAVVAVAGGAVYWCKFRKKPAKGKGGGDLDAYDFGQEEETEEEETEIDDADAMSDRENDGEDNE